MALSNYTNIAAGVESWLNRAGFSSIASNVEDFITLAQRRAQRDVRLPLQETQSTLSITNNRASIPSDMLDVKEMIGYDATTAWPVRRNTYAEVRRSRLSGAKGPQMFDTVAGNFEFDNTSPGVNIDLVYYKEIEFISSTVAENWFSKYAPELILYGALTEAALFTKDTEMEDKYNQRYELALKELKTQKQKAEWSGTALQVNRG